MPIPDFWIPQVVIHISFSFFLQIKIPWLLGVPVHGHLSWTCQCIYFYKKELGTYKCLRDQKRHKKDKYRKDKRSVSKRNFVMITKLTSIGHNYMKY